MAAGHVPARGPLSALGANDRAATRAVAIGFIAVAIALVGLAGCGSTPDRGGLSDPASIQAIVEDTVAAFRREEWRAVCRSLSSQAEQLVGYAAHARPLSCVADVQRFSTWLKRDPSGRPEVTAVTGSSEHERRASAAVRLGDGTQVDLPLRLAHGKWQLAGLFDARLSQVQLRSSREKRAAPIQARRPAPLRGSGQVAVDRAGDDGLPCKPVAEERFPKIVGGCVLGVAGARIPVSLRTAFGVLPFARCGIAFALHVDGQGDGWATRFAVDGHYPCNDFVACTTSAGETLPWRARIEGSQGHLTLRLHDVCFATCVGEFTGDLPFKLVRNRSRWRLRASKAMVGRTGWQLDGDLPASGERLTIDADRRPS